MSGDSLKRLFLIPLCYSLVLKMQYFLVLFHLLNFKKGEVNSMPSTFPGRELVKKFLQENDIKSTDLAKMYGMTKQEVSDYLSGRKTNPAANQFILKVIRDFKI